MKKGRKSKLEEIIDDIKCPEDFKCYTSGFKELRKVTDIGLESFIECLDSKSEKCIFAVPFGGIHFCKCPLRIYIAKELKK